MKQLGRGKRVVAIGLDSADHALVQKWAKAGELPEIAALLREGAQGEIAGATGYTAETPWTIFLTGCWPETTGYWSPGKYHLDYRVEEVEAYDYDAFGHFYDYCAGRKVVAFDVPHARVSHRVDGVQIMAWGAHSPQGPTESLPAGALEEVVTEFGEHPALRKDDILVWETDRRKDSLERELLEGIKRRTKAALSMMQSKPWDLFIVAYGEPHSAGHGFWHLSQPDHPLYAHYAETGHDPMLAVYKEMDAAVGELRRAMPSDAYLVLFSQEGMKSNSADLPSWLFLPELMFRYSFDGKAALAKGEPGAAPPPYAKLPTQEWMRALWGLREGANPITRFADKHLRLRLSHLVDHVLEPGHRLRHPLDCKVYSYMPQLWYQPFWPRMKAFGLPSFSEGNVRINVKGREREGIVAPEDFGKVCAEVTDLVRGLVNPRNGKPIIREVLPQRAKPFDNPRGPDADIIFLWDYEPTDVVDSPAFGRIGPAPFRRTGDHHKGGFFAVAGPGVHPHTLKEGALVDLAPTILDLLDVPPPNHFNGRSRAGEILETAAPVSR